MVDGSAGKRLIMIKKNLLLMLIALFAFSGCTKESNVTVLKLAHVLDVTHPVHKAMVFMGEKLSEKSNGTMRMDIYPSGQLGAERELIELLQIGSLAMTKVSASPMESFVPEMKVFSIPYVFRSNDHFWNVLNGPIGKSLLLSGQDYFLRGLCYYDAGSRSFYTKDVPVNTPADLSGLKIRVMKSMTAVKMVQSLGGSATPISWGELYTALQQGVVDGAENNPPSFYLSKHYEVCKYYSLDEHTSVPDILLMSTKVFDRLSPLQQQWLQEAADESAAFQRELWTKASEDALNEVQKAGVQVIYPDKTPFSDAVVEMHNSYKNTPVYDLLTEIRAVE